MATPTPAVTEPAAARSSGRIELVDYYRLGAAAVVLCFHYFFNGLYNGRLVGIAETPFAPIAQYGYLGVELFFLISGFVIMSSARGRTMASFTTGRALRLVPAFLAALVLTTVVIVLAGERSGITVSPGQFLVNLTMVPGLVGVDPVDGVYWTLQYEVLFYGLVALILLFKPSVLDRAMPIWALLMLAIMLVAPIALEAKPYLGGYYSLFAVGAILAEVRLVGWSPLRAVGLAAGIAVALHWSVVAADMQTEETGVEFSHTVVLIVQAACIALVALPLIPAVARWKLPGSRLAGDLTYPLYLVHAFIGYILMSQLSRWLPDWLDYVVGITTVVLLAWLLHQVVEVRGNAFWRRQADRFVRRPLGLLEAAWRRRHAG
jgi:peptidoglycan/LPS O-acetylase OafA/YrhL